MNEMNTGAHSGHQNHHPDRNQIHFKVDGEPYTTLATQLTPNEIIKDFAGRDPATHYLVQIEGHKKVTYEGKGEIPIEMHDGQRFQVISTGPTPVSDATDD
jgi:hypothetical protein